MRSIGIRCNPHQIFYSITEKNGDIQILSIDEILLPKSLIKAEQLKYARNTMIDIIKEFNVSHAGIRIYENTTRSFDRERVYLEGVFIELLASVELDHYYIGQIANISSYIGIDRADFKRIVNDEVDIPFLPDLSGLGKEHREATLTSIGAY